MSDLKMKAAKAALDYIENDTVVGIGTGSTVNFLLKSSQQSNIKSMLVLPVPKPLKRDYVLKAFPC